MQSGERVRDVWEREGNAGNRQMLFEPVDVLACLDEANEIFCP